MAAKYDVIQWLMTQMSTLGPMFGQFAHFTRFAPAGNDYSKSRYLTQIIRVIEVMEQRLSTLPYLGGAEYGVADIASWPWLRFLPAVFGDAAGVRFPHLTAWLGKSTNGRR
jgi:GST-like protein